MQALTAAAERVAASWPDRESEKSEVAEVLGYLVHTLRARSDVLEIDDRLRTVLGRRLLELLRSELIRGWQATHSGDTSPVEVVLETLGALEHLRAAIEPDWDEHFAAGLSSPDGLGLVVEVAHDLRSPLTSILFLAETLQRGQSGEINELQHRQLGLIYSAALGLSTVSSNVIELARGGNRLADARPAPFSLAALLESLRDMVYPMAEEKGLSVRLLGPASDHRVGYPHALSRVLLNLTTNALKFTEEGFVEVVARENMLTTVEFSVRDTGPGISPQARETLYEPFRRDRGGDRYAFSGTGLGLALSRRLVEAMGSTLEVETQKDWGTRFHFELDLRSADTA
jgi:signal transduction histidine kinase